MAEQGGRACGGRSSNESFMGLVTGDQSQASTPPPTHEAPILNNSLCSHSLPPEGLVSWRHQRDDLTAPERSGFFFSSSPSHPPAHPSTHRCNYTYNLTKNDLCQQSCASPSAPSGLMHSCVFTSKYAVLLI